MILVYLKHLDGHSYHIIATGIERREFRTNAFAAFLHKQAHALCAAGAAKPLAFWGCRGCRGGFPYDGGSQITQLLIPAIPAAQ